MLPLRMLSSCSSVWVSTDAAVGSWLSGTVEQIPELV